MATETVSQCPLCKNTKFSPFLECTDYTTSSERFYLIKCTACSFVITSPRPDADSIGKYYDSDNYISHTGSSSEFFDALYLFVRKFTLAWKTRLIRRFTTPAKISILDYGCGTGEFLKACADLGWQSAGIETSSAAMSKAIALTKLNIKNSVPQLGDQKFDVITLWHVLEHVGNLRSKLSELKLLLKENGILFVAVPNHQSYDATHYGKYWAGFDVPRHLWHFSIPTMKSLLESEGFELKKIHPMKLDAFYVSLLSQKYKSGGNRLGGIFIAVITAMVSNYKARSTSNYSSLIYIATQCS